MKKTVILITGADGEVGHGLIEALYDDPTAPPIITLDMRRLSDAMLPYVEKHIVGNILDTTLLASLNADYNITTVYHLAALLSTRAEQHPEAAHQVNVQGTVNLLYLAAEQAAARCERVKFLYPSSIAVYGLPDLATKARLGPVHEDVYLNPVTMYGANKLYCEHLGRYYTHHYRQLDIDHLPANIDFRGLRYPGLISALTLPSGGTSDYGPEMLHAAAAGRHYAAFVREDTTIPFMVMPDAIKALLALDAAPRAALTRNTYNVTSFSLSAAEIAEQVQCYFPGAMISYVPHSGRQAIVDTWPANVDDSTARADWGWQPDYDVEHAFADYLIPAIKRQYTPA